MLFMIVFLNYTEAMLFSFWFLPFFTHILPFPIWDIYLTVVYILLNSVISFEFILVVIARQEFENVFSNKMCSVIYFWEPILFLFWIFLFIWIRYNNVIINTYFYTYNKNYLSFIWNSNSTWCLGLLFAKSGSPTF